MRITESVELAGRLTVNRQDRHGRIETHRFRNSIVLSGRDLVAKLFINVPIAPISHVAVGTGTTPVTSKDESLGAEKFRKKLKDFDLAQHLDKTDDDKKKITLSADLDFKESNHALTEAGLFNAEAGGVMYNRVTFPPINKTNDFKLTLIWEITF